MNKSSKKEPTENISRHASQSETSSSKQLISYIFPDIRALYFLGLHLLKDICYSEIKVSGFELYIVEQWIGQRKLSAVITSYTGNTQDTVKAIQILLPSNPEEWPNPLKIYYEELLQFAQPKVIAQGALFVTSLFSVPSTLNLLHIECGDLRAVWDYFKANFNLKKLHCGGRSALLLNPPSNAAEEKFSQLYKIPLENSLSNSSNIGSESVPTTPTGLKEYKPYAVVELVTIIQISLGYFHLFSSETIKDGILCSTTKHALDAWWNKYGKLYLDTERPKNESTMGPTTVAAIISLVLSCYNKLVVADCISGKDPFDEVEFYSAIQTFQKKYGLANNNSTYLDHQTIEKLSEVNKKASSSDIFKFKRAVSTTVSDIRGKNNSKNIQHEILTSDLDTLVKNINSGTLSLLWKNPKKKKNNIVNKLHNNGFANITFKNGNPTKELKKQEQIILEQQLLETEERKRQEILHTKEIAKKKSESTSKHNLQSKDGNNIEKKTSFNNKTNNQQNPDSNSKRIISRKAKKKPLTPNQLYKKEYYRRNSIPFGDDGTSNMDLHFSSNRKTQKPELHRCSSTSKIEEVIFPWSLPFDPSLVRMARDLSRIKDQLELKQEEENMSDIYAPTSAMKISEQLEEVNFSNTSSELYKSYQKFAHNAKVFKARNDDIENGKELVIKKMHELDSISSKLKYNIRILDRRMRDVEESIRQFDTRLKTVRDAFSIKCICPSLVSMPISDEREFEIYVKKFMDSERRRYQCLVVRLVRKINVLRLENGMRSWLNWFYNKFAKKSHPFIEDKKNI